MGRMLATLRAMDAYERRGQRGQTPRDYSVSLRVWTDSALADEAADLAADWHMPHGWYSMTYRFTVRARDHKRAERCARLLAKRAAGVCQIDDLALVLPR